MASDKLASFVLQTESVHGLDTGEKKGSGAYGAVYKVTVDGVPCIAKRLHDILVDPEVSQLERASIQQKFHDECVLLSQLRHPNVVHFVGVHYGSNQDDMSLIMECLDTDLARCLKTQPKIPLEVKLSILLDVSYGLLYLHTHSLQVIHRDLTAANILLTRDKRAKIADLGVSKLLDPRTQAAMMQTKAPGTIYYMPPEALKENPNYDEKLDIFSFGHLALYVINQVFPEVFEVSISPVALREETLQILKRRKAIDEMGRDHCLHDVVMNCLQDNPQKRPTTLNLNVMLNHLCMKHPREVEGATENLAQSRMEVTKLTTDVELLCREKVDLREEIEAHKLTAQIFREDFEQERRDREKVHAQLTELEGCNREAKQYKEQVDSLKDQVAELGKLKQYRMQVETLQDRLSELEGHNKELFKERDKLCRELDKTRKDLVKAQTKMDRKAMKDAEKAMKKELSDSPGGATSPEPTGMHTETQHEGNRTLRSRFFRTRQPPVVRQRASSELSPSPVTSPATPPATPPAMESYQIGQQPSLVTAVTLQQKSEDNQFQHQLDQTELESDLSLSMARVTELERGIADMETALSKAEHDRQGVFHELSTVKQQRDTLDQKYLSLLTLNDNLKRQLSKFDGISDDIALVKDKASQWQAALSSQGSELSKLRSENGDLKTEIEARKAEIAELGSRSEGLSHERDELFRELDETRKELVKAKIKAEENSNKDAENVKLSDEGATSPDPTGVCEAIGEQIAENEQPYEDDTTFEDAPLPTIGSLELNILEELEVRELYEA